MTQQSVLDCLEASGGQMGEQGRPVTIHGHSDPTAMRLPRLENGEQVEEISASGEFSYAARNSVLSTISNNTHLPAPVTSKRFSSGACIDSRMPSKSTSSISRPNVLSSTKSTSNFKVDTRAESTPVDPRTSMLSRLRSSISTFSASPDSDRKIQFTDFQLPPEHPERHFIDSVGMFIPGVTDRSQCTHPLAHFVTNWRLCQPVEYTTALADHGITYMDYCRLIAALEDFLNGIPDEPKYRTAPRSKLEDTKDWKDEDSRAIDGLALQTVVYNDVVDLVEQFKRTKHHAAILNRMLADISQKWQARGLPVMVCIRSFSLFTPNRISESHVQILHVSLQPPTAPQKAADYRSGETLSCVFDDALKPEDVCFTVARPKLDRRNTSPASPTSTGISTYHPHQSQQEDRTNPWPLWPNAIPIHKRDLMNGHADRYGRDPYFRAYMRANISSWTDSSSYAKWLTEKEDHSFINTRLDYVNPPSWINLFTKGVKPWKEGHASSANRDNYEHNRRLECRKAVEHGFRLRLARFGFRYPIFPPHTPEMDALGLTKKAYRTIISDIGNMRRNSKSNARDRAPNCMPWLRHIRKRSAESAIIKVSDYIRHVNGQQRKIVWTIEKIQGVYESGLGRTGTEWEISAWNGEDPLELLIQLERWGIIEKKLNIDDDE